MSVNYCQQKSENTFERSAVALRSNGVAVSKVVCDRKNIFYINFAFLLLQKRRFPKKKRFNLIWNRTSNLQIKFVNCFLVSKSLLY